MESDLKNIDPLFDWLRDIYKAEMQIEKLWLAKFKKPNSVSDKIAKLIEELAEVRQAQKETDPEHELEEIVDSVICSIDDCVFERILPGRGLSNAFQSQAEDLFSLVFGNSSLGEIALSQEDQEKHDKELREKNGCSQCKKYPIYVKCSKCGYYEPRFLA